MSQIAAKTYVQEKKKRINARIKKALKEDLRFVGEISKSLESIAKMESHYALAGGKRLRGILTILSYEWFGGTKTKEIETIAAAVELFHTGLIIHDDIIDRDETRRGETAMHKRRLPGRPRNEHIELSIALLLGDNLATLAEHLLLEAEMPLQQKFNAISIFHEEGYRTGLGALLELDATGSTTVTQDRLVRTEQLKTARYTTVAPCKIGAALAGASLTKKHEQLLEELGALFQLRDNEMDIMGEKRDEALPSDVREGHMNPLLYTFRSKLRGEEREIFDAMIKYGPRSEHVNGKKRKVIDIKTLYRERGVQQEVQAEIEQRWERLRKEIVALKAPSGKKALLKGIAEQHVFRSY